MPAQISRDILHPLAKSFILKAGGAAAFNNTEIEALNYLVESLFISGLWNKFRAIYPFIGGRASTHSINLKNPYRHNIKWYGAVTHDRLGVTGAGGYGNTLCASGWLDENDMHLSVYNATMWTAANNSSNLIGVATPTQQITLRNASSRYTYSSGDGVYFSGYLVNDFKHIEAYGLIMGVNSQICYVGGQRYGTIGASPASASIDPMSAEPILIFSEDNFGSVVTKSSTNIRFASIGWGMNDSEAALFYQIVETFQTMLSRNVGLIHLGSTTYPTDVDKITTAISILRVAKRIGMFTQPFEDAKITVDMGIRKITLYGARHTSQAEKIYPSLTLISLAES